MNGYVQDERYIASEHMDVRRDRVHLAQRQWMCDAIVSILHSVNGCAVRLFVGDRKP